MNVAIYSREMMKAQFKIGLPKNTAVISFYDPKSRRNVKDYAPLDYGGKCKDLFMVAVHDIDIEILGDYGLTFDTYFSEAGDLSRFILEAEKAGKDIICQCDYGQSRSAACAAAIREFFYGDGIKILQTIGITRTNWYSISY